MIPARFGTSHREEHATALAAHLKRDARHSDRPEAALR
jgi:hypothetical protein